MKSELVIGLKGLHQAVESQQPEGLFGRNCRVRSKNISLNMRDYDIEVESEFDDTLNNNEAQIVVYNLTDATIGDLEVGAEIVVEAGYKEDVGIVFSGYIEKVKVSYEGSDKKITIYALDKLLNQADAVEATHGKKITTNNAPTYTDVMGRTKTINSQFVMANTTYTTNTKASYILRDLVGKTGYPIGEFKVESDHTYTDTVSVTGSLAENIQKYSEVCGVSTYMSNGKIYVHKLTNIEAKSIVLDEEHGLIERIEEVEDAEEETIKLKTLLIHQLRVGSVIELKTKRKSGRYVIKQLGIHINEEDFISDIEAVAKC